MGLRGQILGLKGQISDLRGQILGLLGQVSGLRGLKGLGWGTNEQANEHTNQWMNKRSNKCPPVIYRTLSPSEPLPKKTISGLTQMNWDESHPLGSNPSRQALI